jgi:hypothetical protein
VACLALEESMRQGWQGVFPEKVNTSAGAAMKVHLISSRYDRGGQTLDVEDW